jgi:outer membrane protein assembly factor BamA
MWTPRPWSGDWEREDAHAALAEIVIGASGPGGDADFRRFVLELRGRQRLTWSQFFAYRLRGGAGQTDGNLNEAAAADTTDASPRPDLPFAWRFRSGGIGTLRGHQFQEFAGDRELLGTLEYGLELPRQIRPILFIDSGRTWVGRERHGGGVGGSGPWLVDGGVGLQLGAGPLSGRLDLARDLRAERSTARLSFRLGFPF